MSSFTHLGLASLDKRLAELDIILSEASKYFEREELIYNALCRSAQVLLIAHFEGYIKDLVKNVLDDINYYSSFKDCGKQIKYTFCENFILPNGDGKVNHKKIEELIEVFDSLDTKLKKEYFLYSGNKNPKESVLDNIAKRFGINNLFKKLQRSKLDLVFSNTNPENKGLATDLRHSLSVSTQTFPYDIDLSLLEISEENEDNDNLWGTFISNILMRRHDIAHGKEIDNTISHTVIETDKVKVEILLYAFTLMICEKCNPVVSLHTA